MSGWIPREPPEYQDDWDLFEMFINGDLIYEPPRRSGKTALVNKALTEAKRRGVKVGVLKGSKSTGFAIDEWMYEPPIVMPTDWLAEVRAMCRKPPFRLGGDYVVRQIKKCH